jgi:nitrous oxidase accessory protein NosD
MPTTTRSGLLAVVALLALGAAAPDAGADTINVRPDRPDAIQKGIDRASRGDTVRVHKGRYKEDIVVDKRLKLTDAGDGRPVVDGECETLRTIDVDHNGVVVKDLKIVGAEEGGAAAINFDAVEKGTARGLVLRDTCGDGPGAGALYGVNAYEAERLTVADNNAKGFSDAGIYIGHIETTGSASLRVVENETFGNARGILIEDVAAAADVRVRGNDTHDNGEGIFVHISDAVLFAHNQITDNTIGVRIDEGSDGNTFNGNTFSGNATNVDDEGVGNCGAGNSPEVFDPC